VKFVVASGNPDKLRELRRLLAAPGLELVGLPAGADRPEEHGATLLDNARIKARAAVAATGLPAIADDTGLEVDALGGRPGVHAARFAGPQASYDDNVARLLRELAGVPPARRAARFRTACVACFPDGGEVAAEGVLEGAIAEQPRGANGFGYDPVFEVAGTGRTLGEMPEEEKNRLSHRARAAAGLLQALGPRAR
jgi:XTP/dITP diphosphohydrolase